MHFLFNAEVAQLGRVIWFNQGVAGSNPVFPIHGGVAQLARASGSYLGGRGFDPPPLY